MPNLVKSLCPARVYCPRPPGLSILFYPTRTSTGTQTPPHRTSRCEPRSSYFVKCFESNSHTSKAYKERNGPCASRSSSRAQETALLLLNLSDTYKLFAGLVYGSGLRTSEGLRLR